MSLRNMGFSAALLGAPILVRCYPQESFFSSASIEEDVSLMAERNFPISSCVINFLIATSSQPIMKP